MSGNYAAFPYKIIDKRPRRTKRGCKCAQCQRRIELKDGMRPLRKIRIVK